jgi:hypothetical protein
MKGMHLLRVRVGPMSLDDLCIHGRKGGRIHTIWFLSLAWALVVLISLAHVHIDAFTIVLYISECGWLGVVVLIPDTVETYRDK